MKYALPVAWLTLFAYRLASGSSEPFTLWLLRILTVALVLLAVLAIWRFVAERIAAVRRGEKALGKATVRSVLIATAIVGAVIRVAVWDPGHEGVLAWVGGLMLVSSVGGLVWLQFVKEKEAGRFDRQSFYFNPYWKYGLLLTFLVALSIQGLVRPEGAASTLNAGAFWAALIALIVQSVGRLVAGSHRVD